VIGIAAVPFLSWFALWLRWNSLARQFMLAWLWRNEITGRQACGAAWQFLRFSPCSSGVPVVAGDLPCGRCWAFLVYKLLGNSRMGTVRLTTLLLPRGQRQAREKQSRQIEPAAASSAAQHPQPAVLQTARQLRLHHPADTGGAGVDRTSPTPAPRLPPGPPPGPPPGTPAGRPHLRLRTFSASMPRAGFWIRMARFGFLEPACWSAL